jgi:Uma2 family endonuclease
VTSAIGPTSKAFEPGTTGWTASDLEDPTIEREWFRGRYEIVEGVLTKMPPAYFVGGESLQNLLFLLHKHFHEHGLRGSFATEVDMVIDEARVAVADAVFLTAAERVRQDEASRLAGKIDSRRARILVPPTLIVESISPAHELHDYRTKRRWYGEFGVPNYWILDAFEKSLTCLVLERDGYRQDQKASVTGTIAPSAFPGLTIELPRIWGD